jgi:hypothetical protein
MILGIISSILFFLSGRSVQKRDKIFLQTYEETQGYIVGYRTIDMGEDKPRVNFFINDKKVLAEAKSKKVTVMTHPKGTAVRIFYKPMKVLWFNGYDARIVNPDGVVPTSRTGVIVLYSVAGFIAVFSVLLYLSVR